MQPPPPPERSTERLQAIQERHDIRNARFL